jgi:hypothetical protein
VSQEFHGMEVPVRMCTLALSGGRWIALPEVQNRWSAARYSTMFYYVQSVGCL